MTEINFEFKEDRDFFQDLLCNKKEELEDYYELFDFRDPKIKRKEFNKIRNKLLRDLIKRKEKICELKLCEDCDINKEINLDHLIPLSTNELNKKLRNFPARFGKKVEPQSFGSNNKRNIVLACFACNSHKKHKFLDKEDMKRLLNKSLSRRKDLEEE